MTMHTLRGLALVLLLVACGSAEDSTEDTAAFEQTDVTTASAVIEEAAEEAAPETIETEEATTTTAAGESEEPESDVAVDSSPNGETADVVLVRPTDVLNIRYGPGVSFDIAGDFGPTATDLPLTDVTDVVNGTPWVFVDGNGWVSAFFLTPSVSPETFATSGDPFQPIYELADVFSSNGDLTRVASWRGLYLALASDLRAPDEDIPRFRPSALPGLLTDTAPFYWGYCQEGECSAGDFSEEVGASFVSAATDADTELILNTLRPGPGGAPAAAIIPTQFENLNFIAVHDPGDDPDADGLDWMTWYVFIETDSDGPHVVGLLLDQWQP